VPLINERKAHVDSCTCEGISNTGVATARG
jgi:hypothetical protein